MANKPNSHITHSGSINLLQLQGAAEVELQTPQGVQKCIVIPTNNPCIGRKKDGTPFLALSIYEYDTPDQYGQSHYMRTSFPSKQAREGLTKEQQDAYTPIVGNLKPAKAAAAANQNPYAQQQPQGGYGAPQGGYGVPQGGYQQPQGGYSAPQPQGGYAPTPQGGYGAPQQSGYAPQPQGGYAPAPQQSAYAPQDAYQQRPADISQADDMPADIAFNPNKPSGPAWNR